METFSVLLAICAGNSPVTGEFPAQRPVTQSFNVFFDLRLNKQLSKQSWGWWFETLLRPLWRHCNAYGDIDLGQRLTQVIGCCLTAPSHYLNQMLTYHQCGLLAFTFRQFHRRYSWCQCKMSLDSLLLLYQQQKSPCKLGLYHCCWCPGS